MLSACVAAEPLTEPPSILDPKGPIAAQISTLWWIMFWMGTAIFLGVTLYLMVALFRRRGAESKEDAAGGRRVVFFGGILFPTIILLVVYGITFGTLSTFLRGSEHDIEIQVIGHQWWWEVQYTDPQFVTANEIHIPVGDTVQLKLTTDDVIHSFWIPQLHGKLDLIPNQVNTINLRAEEPGVYLGECAEFCGVQHAKMLFLVVAHPPESYAAWVADQVEPAEAPASEGATEGLQVFLNSGCANCHTIEGTHATGDLGPDLTHLASRRTIASGILPNTRGNLAGWIADPQSIKLGNFMPPTALTGPELQSLLDYLETLE